MGPAVEPQDDDPKASKRIVDVSLFDFELPEDRIALRPADRREAAKLLVVRPGDVPELDDRRIADLPDLLRPGDSLVVNDTRVIPARLTGIRERESGDRARIEATLVERIGAAGWRALVRPARRLAPGDRVRFGDSGSACLLGTLDASVVSRAGGEVEFAFDLAGDDLDRAIEAAGDMPLPPYIAARRRPDAQDRGDYQTMFAAETGAVAAPTAGLHFTPELVAQLADRDMAIERVTLHVGPGTFLPVTSDTTEGHVMHAELGRLDAATADRLNARRAAGGRIVAVGSTVMRVLETAAAGGRLQAWSGSTDIFITPGYRFRAVNAVLTNFHLPRSTLVMLVAAFVGLDVQRRAYAHAIAHGYRFYSYGDACLLFPAAPSV
jgi:S-adenosylmethionine:tRNA ribosyltransferase-isomerase